VKEFSFTFFIAIFNRIKINRFFIVKESVIKNLLFSKGLPFPFRHYYCFLFHTSLYLLFVIYRQYKIFIYINLFLASLDLLLLLVLDGVRIVVLFQDFPLQYTTIFLLLNCRNFASISKHYNTTY
jgi:hypothetical protein